MLTKIDVFSPRLGEPQLTFSFTETESDPVQVRNIVGLGPVKATVNTTPFTSTSGESFFGSNIGKRNIVMTLGLNPNYADQTMEGLRQLLYRYLMPQKRIELEFTTSELSVVGIAGYVEAFEPNIFSKDPEIQVSIICPLPDFIAVEPTIVTGSTTTTPTSQNIPYEGTVDTGFTLKVESGVSLPTYYDTFLLTMESLINRTMAIDILEITETQYFEMESTQGNKHVLEIDPGISTDNLLGRMTLEGGWPKLDVGPNNIDIFTETEGLPWTLTYYARYGGL